MSDMDPTPPDHPAPGDRKKRKQADKARGVWISFAGRIVAQIVGAVASVVLGIMVLQRYQQPAAPAEEAGASPAVARPSAPAPRRPPRKPGATRCAPPRRIPR